MRDTAIRTIHTNVVTVNGERDATDANGTIVVLDEALITAEVARLQAEYNSKQYSRNRAEAYPSLEQQADMAYWDRQNGTTTLDDAITAVKIKYPKAN